MHCVVWLSCKAAVYSVAGMACLQAVHHMQVHDLGLWLSHSCSSNAVLHIVAPPTQLSHQHTSNRCAADLHASAFSAFALFVNTLLQPPAAFPS